MFCPVCRGDYPDDWKACPKDATLLLRSAQIGKYTIEGLLGVGGMGAVYRATNPDTRSRVAIKVMNPAVATAESARARFQREAASVAALSTTHVVKVFDFGEEDDGTLYLVMELLEGHPLRDEIAPPPTAIDLARVQMIMEGALKGLAAAHKAGIVHRDLKPENIFVAQTDDGEVPKLVDFGIARVRTADSDLTRTGTLVGTASYMAPEQIAAGAGDIGPWSDVYAMGSILYELLAGVAAFGGDSLTDVLGRVLRGEHTSLKDVRPGLPAETYRFVERCMNPDPMARPQDADAMRRELTAARLVAPGTPIPEARVIKRRAQTRSLLASAPTEASAPNALAYKTPGPDVRPPSAEIPMGNPKGSHYDGGLAGDAPKKFPIVPVAIAGFVLAGVVAFVLARGGTTKVTPDAAPRPIDAAVAQVDAAPAIDAAIAVATIDAAPDDTVAIAAGTYEVGVKGAKAPDDLPLAKVTVGAFAIDKHEMTKRELLATGLWKTADKAKDDPDDAPARFVDFATASAACAKHGKRLPTEAEWEVAARTTPQKSVRRDLTKPSTDCSDAGLCDMLGSLIEWTTTKAAKRGDLVVRGSSYKFDPDQVVVTIHNRLAVPATTVDNELGFRCVREDKR